MNANNSEQEFGLSENTITLLQNVFASYSDVEQVIIYGSRAKGNYKNGSDIDLTIKGTSVTDSVLLRIMGDIDDLPIPYSVDLSLYHKITNLEFLDHIDRNGVVFFSR